VEREEIVHKLMAMVRLSLEPPVGTTGLEMCRRYGDTDYQRVLDETMSIEELSEFASHSEHCHPCLLALAQRSWGTEARIRSEMAVELYRRTLDLLDQLETGPRTMAPVESAHDSQPTSLFRITLEKVKDIWRVVETTGTMLAMPEPVAVRGKTSGQARSPLRLLQEFIAPPVSVQVNMEPESTAEQILIRVSLFDTESEQFMDGVKIMLAGSGIETESITDSNGEVWFELPSSGAYAANIVTGTPLVLELTLVKC
jgi:hypothetical protein